MAALPSLRHLLAIAIFVFFVAIAEASSPSWLFSPADNYLIDCGSSEQTRLADGRTFKSERDTATLLSSSGEDIRLSADSVAGEPPSSVPSSSLPLLTTLRVFAEESTYSFHISQPGRHFVRLYFYPIADRRYNLSAAGFRVTADSFVLLDDFSVAGNETAVFKEYLVNASERFSLVFTPKPKSLAFVNAIEVVSAPDSLVPDSAESLSPLDSAFGLSTRALEVDYRVNVGGPVLSPGNDTLYRSWVSDEDYNVFKQGSRPVFVDPEDIGFPGSGETSPLIAPPAVYSSAQRMQDPATLEPSFNLTWNFTVDVGYSYLVRFFFCDIISLAPNSLFFNVYINGMTAVSSLDLPELATAYHRDFVLGAANVRNGTITVQVGCSGDRSGVRDAILNGLEIMKLSDSAGSLAGILTSGPNPGFTPMKIAAAVGLGLAVTATVLLGSVFVRRRRLAAAPPRGWEKRRSFSSWLLGGPGAGDSWSSRSSRFGSRRSKSGHSTYFASPGGFGRVFALSELQAATRGFAEESVIGVGGFGKVFLGTLDDGTKLAVKRGNPSSEQGLTEFRTEIETLSRLRHRHLVSLVGFCDERDEMILVYEYMSNGPLRDHLYGSTRPALPWKTRLEICIGAARGLHYLHTGAAGQGIIHRDVKSTNILLDNNFLAKVSDFGLSKTRPALNQSHVSTAVKGSFGYLDPGYFQRQQLTEKSDVYSFGVVLLEALCARAAVDPKLPREQVNVAEWAMRWHRQGMVEKVVDARISGTIRPESLKTFVGAAEKCLAEDGSDRPSMGDVLRNLELALQLQEAPMAVDESDSKMEEARLVIDCEVGDESSVSVDGNNLFSQIAHFKGRYFLAINV